MSEPGFIQRVLRADYPERVTALSLLIGCGCLGSASIILAVASARGKEVGTPMGAVCAGLAGLIGYAYGKGKAAEAPK